MSFGVYDFISRWGYEIIFGIFAGVTAGIGLFIIPVWLFGKNIRSWVADTFPRGNGAQR